MLLVKETSSTVTSPTTVSIRRAGPTAGLTVKLVPAGGDFNGDGRGDLVILETTQVKGASELLSGRAYVFWNGDGLSDLITTDSNYVAETGTTPASGRAYLLLGRGGLVIDSTLNLTTNVLLASPSLGGPISALGDLNQDGYDDFALSRTREDGATAAGSLLIYRGSANFSTASAASLTVRQADTADLGASLSLVGGLTGSAGDFNGDGQMDLAVGRPTSILTDSRSANPDVSTILDAQQRGDVSLFFSISSAASTLSLAEASVVLRGEGEADQLGTFATSPALDLNDDGISDLVVGAARADSTSGTLTTDSGKVYVAYGTFPTITLPSTALVLSNRTLTGGGDFLVDPGTGSAEHFENLNLDGVAGSDIFLDATHSEHWFRFTTLGDGLATNHITLSPGYVPPSQTFLLGGREGMVDAVGQITSPSNFVSASSTDLTLDTGTTGRFGILEFDLGASLDYQNHPTDLSLVRLVLVTTSAAVARASPAHSQPPTPTPLETG